MSGIGIAIIFDSVYIVLLYTVVLVNYPAIVIVKVVAECVFGLEE